MGYTKGRITENQTDPIIVPVEQDSERYKWCNQCRQWVKAPEGWSSNVAQYDGLTSQCKKCDVRNRVIRRQNKKIEQENKESTEV
jgi:hypothetical protein